MDKILTVAELNDIVRTMTESKRLVYNAGQTYREMEDILREAIAEIACRVKNGKGD